MSDLPKKPLLDVEAYERDGQAWMTSLEVARVFEKEHKHIMRDIENLEAPEDFSRLNFELREYTDDRGKTYPMYELTNNGLTFLVMGFTGQKAAEFKEAYIEAFDAMEQHIKDQRMAINELYELYSQIAAVLSNMAVKTSEEFERQDKKIDDFGERQEVLERSQELLGTFFSPLRTRTEG